QAQIIEQGKPDTLYYMPQHPYTAQLLAKSNILNPKQASAFGISTTNTIAIHQEDIHYTIAPQGTFWAKEILFRGFYKELIITDGENLLHTIMHPITNIQRHDKVNLRIEKHIVFNQQRRYERLALFFQRFFNQGNKLIKLLCAITNRLVDDFPFLIDQHIARY